MPPVKQPIIIIATPFIGASPQDVETQITLVIEEKLEELKDVERIKSSSVNGASVVQVKFYAGTDIDDKLRAVRDKVREAKVDFPPDVEESSIVDVDFDDIPVILLALSGDAPRSVLYGLAESIKRDLRSIPDAGTVDIVGASEPILMVEFDPLKLTQLEVGMDTAIGALRRNFPFTVTGKVKEHGRYLNVRLLHPYTSIQEIENMNLGVQGRGSLYQRCRHCPLRREKRGYHQSF